MRHELTSSRRPSLAELRARHIFLSPRTVVSRRLARSLVAIRLQRRLARRPPPLDLVHRAVLPGECVPSALLLASSTPPRSASDDDDHRGSGCGSGSGKSVPERRRLDAAVFSSSSMMPTMTHTAPRNSTSLSISHPRGIPVVAPALVARRREFERARVKDSLRRWVGGVWIGQVRMRGESVARSEETTGVGRVWRLTRFWEKVGRGEEDVTVRPPTSGRSSLAE